MAQIPSQILAGDALWELLDEQTLSVAAAAVTFSGIDTTFTFLRVTFWVQFDSASTIQYTLNSDVGANYDRQYVLGDAGSPTAQRSTGDSAGFIAGGGLANEHSQGVLTIAKPVAGEEGQAVVLTGPRDGANANVQAVGGQWNNTAALISRIDMSASVGNLDANSRILLEGARPAA